MGGGEGRVERRRGPGDWLSRHVLEAATEETFAHLGYFRRRPAKLAGVAIDVSRTGYTGDLGYELWIPATRAVRSGTR